MLTFGATQRIFLAIEPVVTTACGRAVVKAEDEFIQVTL